MLRSHLDARLEAQVTDFDAGKLEKFMWDLDAPYQIHRSSVGGAQVVARGRSAVALCEWLSELLEAPR